MTPGQETIPVDEARPLYGYCAWCGLGTREQLEVAPARWTSTGGVRRLKKAAVMVWVCSAHMASLELKKKEVDEGEPVIG